jgi:hypothetical protein
VPVGDHPPQQPGRFEALTEAVAQVLGDAEPHIPPHQIAEFQRTHRMPVPQRHCRVDVVGSRDALLDHPDRLEAEQHAKT